MDHLIRWGTIVAAGMLVAIAGLRLSSPLPALPRGSQPLLLNEWRHLGDAGIGRGATGGSVTVVVWSDYTCTFCRQADSVLVDLLDDHADRLSLVYRQHPSASPTASLAASIAHCAHEQGAFHSTNRLLYDSLHWLQVYEREPLLLKFGVDDPAELNRCVEEEAPEAIARDLRLARAVGVTGTPGVAIDSLLFTGFPGARYLKAYIAAFGRGTSE